MITAPISVGELIDKLSILQVKKRKIIEDQKLEYINKEFEMLYNLSAGYLNHQEIENSFHELVEVNSTLWDVEDKLREYEKIKSFPQHFIELARKVYYTNDKRFEIKNKINEMSNSEIREQKSYQEYDKINDIEEPKETRYIYESPDGGKTVYRRLFGEPHDKRELVNNG